MGEFSASTPLFLSAASSLGCRVSSGAQIPHAPPAPGIPPQQEGFREGDKYQMGEGRAARNTLPACQELLARVGAWAGEGGGCPCSRRLLTSFPRAQQPAKDGTIRQGPAPPRSPLPPRVLRGGNTSPVLTAQREAATPPVLGYSLALAPPGSLPLPDPAASPAWHGSGQQHDSPPPLTTSQSLLCQTRGTGWHRGWHRGCPAVLQCPHPQTNPLCASHGYLVGSRTVGSSQCPG